MGNPRIKYIKIFYVNYIIMKNHIKLPPILKSSSSESESESESELELKLKPTQNPLKQKPSSKSESESESDISDVESPFEGKIKRLHQMIVDLNETEHKIHNIHLVSSPEIAHALARRMVRTLKQYIKLRRNVIGPIKNETMLVA